MKILYVSVLLFLAAAPDCRGGETGLFGGTLSESLRMESYRSSRWEREKRRRELVEEYGTASPTWEMLSPTDKLGTAFCAAVVGFFLVSKLRG